MNKHCAFQQIIYNGKKYNSLVELYREYIPMKENEHRCAYHKRCRKILLPERAEKYKIQNTKHKRIVYEFKKLCKIECY